MSREGELLEQILASPDDDAPRLVLADVLMGRGDSRGEFIAVQCALARLAPGAPERTMLCRRERQLLAAHEARWRQELGIEALALVTFRRGFVDALDTRGQPVPDGVWTQPLKRLTASQVQSARPEIRRLEHLGFSHLDRDACVAFADRTDFERLVSLSVGAGMDREGLAMVINAPGLRALRELKMREPDAAELVASVPWTQLRTIAYDELPARAVRRLVDTAWFARIAEARFDRGEIEDSTFDALAQCTELRRVSLNHCSNVRPFASPAWLANITSLSLNYTKRSALAKLADAPLQRLEALSLECVLDDTKRNATLGARDAAVLGRAPLVGLRKLHLGSNNLGPTGAANLANSEHLADLESLSLTSNKIKDAGIAAILGSPLAARLSELELSDNGITNQGIRTLLDARCASTLRRLGLGELPNDAAAELARSTAIDLETVYVVAKDPDLAAQLHQRWGPADTNRRVHHEHFGDGSVLETRGGKLTVIFDLHGRKVLASEHLTNVLQYSPR